MSFAPDPRPSNETGRLFSCRILVIEGDYFVASELAGVLRFHGASVLGPASTIDDGRRIALAQQPDCVLLDVKLRGESAFALADELLRRGIATIFTTGYDSDVLPDRLRKTICLRKPLGMAALLDSIDARPQRYLQ